MRSGRYPVSRCRGKYPSQNPPKREASGPAPILDRTIRRVLKDIGTPAAAPFTPDPFQRKALEATAAGDCLVSAPTGGGKTWIAIRAIESMLGQGKKAWYACPLKALSNDKYREFKIEFGQSRVGILTGDRKENPEAAVIVGTTEILRNQLYDAMHTGESLDTDFIVLDEAHYIGDRERGVVWEEVIIYAPTRIPILLLSATIGNAEMVAGWLESLRDRPCRVIKEKKRPVALFHTFFHPTQGLLPLFVGKGKNRGMHPSGLQLTCRSAKFRNKRIGRVDLGIVLATLKEGNLLPAIFFLKSRADCDAVLGLFRHYRPMAGSQEKKRHRYIEEFIRHQPRLKDHVQLGYLKNQAIGAHHAGQLPGWKLLLEALMNQRMLDAVFATSTVAAGVNFPARTVVFLNSDRFDGKEFSPLSPTEFHQMTGRAGRRGMDRIGFTLAIPGRYMDLEWVAALACAPPSDVKSQIQINFSMTLNLLLSHSPEQIVDILHRSFASFQAHPVEKHLVAKDLERQFYQHLTFLSAHGYAGPDGVLTDDGIWASKLRTDQPLLIAEGLRRGVFPESSPELLSAVISAIMNEKETGDGWGADWREEKAFEAIEKAGEGLRTFVGSLNESGFQTRPLYHRPAIAIFHWAGGASWEAACRFSQMAEGDFAMLVLRTCDCLRHLGNLMDVFPTAAASANRSIRQMMKEPVIEEA